MRPLLALLLLALTACGSDAPDLTTDGLQEVQPDTPLAVEGAYAAPAPTGGTGGVFLTIQGGSAGDALLSAAYPAAERVELHRTTAGEDGMMQMAQIDRLEVRPGGSVQLEPGGYHLMLINLSQPLVAGQTAEVELTFENAGVVTVPVDVRPLNQLPSLGGNESIGRE
jgi:copper(I)-binding protein